MQFIIRIGKSQELLRIVQELLVKNNISNGGRFYTNQRGELDFCLRVDGDYYAWDRESYYVINYPSYPIYDAATQFGEIVKLVSGKEIIIDGYSAKFNENTVAFGGTYIDNNLLELLNSVAKTPVKGNSEVRSIVIGDRCLTTENIRNIVEHPRFKNS